MRHILTQRQHDLRDLVRMRRATLSATLSRRSGRMLLADPGSL